MKRNLVIVPVLAGLTLLTGCPSESSTPTPAPVSEESMGTHADRGRTLLAAGDFDGAEKEFALGAAATPPERGVASGLVALALARNQINIAKEQLAGNRALLGRRNPWLVAVVDGIQRDEEPPRLDDPETGKSPGLGEPQTALSEKETALKTFMGAGQFQEVLDALEGKASLPLTSVRLLADAHWNLRQWKKAVPLYRQILRTDSNDTGVTLHLADTLMHLKRFDESILLYQILADSYPNKPGYWKLLGDAAKAKDDKILAIRAYTTALERGHDKSELTSVVEKLVQESKAEAKPTP